MSKTKNCFYCLLVTCSLLIPSLISAPAKADWPNDQPITMIVSYAPGGATDIAARLAAVYLEKYLNQSVVVLNRPGAGGEIGFTALSESKPDGYTIGFLNTPNVLTIPMQRQTRYQLESFIPVAQLMDDPDAFLVLKDSPLNNLSDLMALIKAKEGKVTYCSTGIGSDDHIAAEMFSLAAGVTFKHVPFDGAGTARTALLGGHIDLGIFNISEAKEFVASGQIKILGQMSHERTDLFPDVLTFKEQGYDITMSSIRGIGLPAGTPKDIVDKFAKAAEQTIKDPEFIKKCEEANIPLIYLNPTDFQAKLENSRTSFQKIWDNNPWVQEKK
jgi:tripartite-type tricarboxylate transporter receptor subunit TctC